MRNKFILAISIWRKGSRKRRLPLLAGLACTLSLLGVAYLAHTPAKEPAAKHTVHNMRKEAASQPPAPKPINYGLPLRLKIPKLTVDAPVTYVGLTKAGAMAAPSNITDVGWYKYGTLPGNKGSAVLAGHIDGLKGQPGVFAGLDKLQTGDTLEVIDSNNTVVSFTVRETRTYSQNEQPSEVFNDATGAHLNLITCTGAWDNTQRHFLERLVVFTDKSG